MQLWILITTALLAIYISSVDISNRQIGNEAIIAVAALSVATMNIDNFSVIYFIEALVIGIALFALKIFAGGDIKLMLAYLLGINTEWWPAVMMIVTGLGGVMALAYLLYGYFTNTMKAVRQKGLPYGVPIAIGGCLGVLLSAT